MKLSITNHGGRAHFLCTSDREASVGQVSNIANIYSEEELAQLRDGITTYLNALPKPCVHAKDIARYAEDAQVHPRPWELWEIKGVGVFQACWSQLTWHPRWGQGALYRRKGDV